MMKSNLNTKNPFHKKKITFTFHSTFEDMISIGDDRVAAALCLSERPLLLDPGVSVFGPLCYETIARHCAHPEDLTIALSHSHFDHCGAVSYLMRKIPGAKLAASDRAAGIFVRPNAIKLIRQLNAEYEKELHLEPDGEDLTFDALDVAYRLKNGGTLQLGGDRICRAYETPGHTRDSMSYFFPDTGIVYIGDAAGAFENGIVQSPFLVSYEDYITSLEKLRNLRPEAVCIPHNGFLIGRAGIRYLTYALEAAQVYKDIIVKYLDLYKGDTKRVIDRIMAEEYDAATGHVQNRQPFKLNLTAKVKAVDARREHGK